MSFRGPPRGRGGSSGSFRGGGFSSRGRGGFQQPTGPPSQVLEMGTFMHACEGQMVYESINPKIPYFNAPIYLENKTSIGKVDEILGPISQVYFTVKPQDGILATSFKTGDKVFIGPDKLLTLDRFLPKDKPPPGVKPPKMKRAGGAAPRGGRGAPRGFSRGGSRGASRGGSSFSRGGSSRGGSSFSRGSSGSRGYSGPSRGFSSGGASRGRGSSGGFRGSRY